MKGSNSRQNFDAKTRFSNLFQVQGGMITDADLDEKALIAQARDEVITTGAIYNGVPDVDGMIIYGDDGKPLLQPGLVFAQGKAGRFALANPMSEGAKLEEIWDNQADFRDAPTLPDGPQLIYADLWERTIFAGQDAALTDPGLHGTETSYRTKTMVQLKSMPLEDDTFDGVQFRMDGRAQFAAKGAATLAISATESDIQVAGCDPCADQIVVDDTLPNMLWRLEIVDVTRNPGSNRPTAMRVAWSAENAAVMDRNTGAGRDGVGREGSVYQFLSDQTETHQGWLPGDFIHHRSEFTPDVEAVPDPRHDGSFTHVRRWDAMADIDIDSSAVTDFMGSSEPDFRGDTLTISTRFFQATLSLNLENMMIGDYWLVEVRRFARADDQIRLIGANDDGKALPIGIQHHYCPLMIAEGGDAQQPPQTLRQITQMPTLSTLEAQNVGYTPPEDCPVYGDARNVKTALDAICSLEAKNVAITPPPGCDTLAETDNVQDALAALCAADNERNLRVMLRTMMDWGVVCGLRLTADPNNASVIRYTGGTALNREGLLRELGDGELDLNKFEKDQIHGELTKLQSLYGEICLSVELQEDGDPRFHLSSPSYPYVDSDKTLKQRIASCLQNETRIDDSEIFKSLGDKDMLILSKVMTSWTNREAVGRAFEINEEELEIGLEIFTKLKVEFLKQQDEATQARLNTLVKGADDEFQQRLKNEATDTPNQRLRYLVALFGILARVEADSQSSCTCAAALPGCSVHNENKPVLIPIGCVKLAAFDEGKLVLNEVCDLCCRKLAHTWHNYRYYFGDQMADQIKEYEDTCCSYFDDAAGLEDFLDRWTPTEDQLDPNSGSPFWPPDPGISNQIGRKGPDVRGVTIERAKELFDKTGVNLNDDFIFERKEGDLFERIRERLEKPHNRPLGLVFEARTEDEVGLIVDSGTVVDLFVVKASPYYGFNNVKGREVIIDSGGSSDGGTFDLAGADFKQNTGFKALFDTVGELLDADNTPVVIVDGATINLDDNPTISDIMDRIENPPEPYELAADPVFMQMEGDIESLRDGSGINADNLVLRNNSDFIALQGQIGEPGGHEPVNGATLDLTGNPSIPDPYDLSADPLYTQLQARLGQVEDGTGIDGAGIDLSENTAFDDFDGTPTPVPDPYDLSADPLYTQLQTRLEQVEDGTGIDGAGINLEGHPDLIAPGDSTPPDGATLDISDNQAITDLNTNIGRLDTRIDTEAVPYVLADDPLYTQLQGRLGRIEDGSGINGLGIDLDDHPDLVGLGDNTPPNGATLNISGNQAVIDLQGRMTAAEAGTGVDASGLNLNRNQAFTTLKNSIPTNLGSRLTNAENRTGLTMDDVMGDDRIQALIAELAECKLMIRRMTPLGDIIDNDNLSILLERGITTVGAASDQGQKGLEKIISKEAALQVMTRVNNHLQGKK